MKIDKHKILNALKNPITTYSNFLDDKLRYKHKDIESDPYKNLTKKCNLISCLEIDGTNLKTDSLLRQYLNDKNNDSEYAKHIPIDYNKEGAITQDDKYLHNYSRLNTNFSKERLQDIQNKRLNSEDINSLQQLRTNRKFRKFNDGLDLVSTIGGLGYMGYQAVQTDNEII